MPIVSINQTVQSAVTTYIFKVTIGCGSSVRRHAIGRAWNHTRFVTGLFFSRRTELDTATKGSVIGYIDAYMRTRVTDDSGMLALISSLMFCDS